MAAKKEMIPAGNLDELRQRVVQSNPLVRAQYKLGEVEGKILRLMLAKIDTFRDKSLKKIYRVDVGEVEAMLGYGKPGYVYDLLMSAMHVLRNTDVTVIKDDENIYCKWVSSVGEQRKEKGFVTYCFDARLEPELIQLKGNYTAYVVRSIRGLSGQYTPRMFELLLQWVNADRAGFPLFLTAADVPAEYADVRDVMNFEWIFQHPYQKFGELRRAILDRAKREIEGKTNLRFEYRLLKKIGKKVCGVQFYNIHLEEEVPASVVSLIRESPCQSDKKVLGAIRKYIDLHGEQYVTDRIHNANAKAITNWKAFFLKSLDNPDWSILNEETPIPRQEHLPSVKASLDAVLKPGVIIRFDGRDYEFDGNGIMVDGERLLPTSRLREKILKNEAEIIDITPKEV